MVACNVRLLGGKIVLDLDGYLQWKETETTASVIPDTEQKIRARFTPVTPGCGRPPFTRIETDNTTKEYRLDYQKRYGRSIDRDDCEYQADLHSTTPNLNRTFNGGNRSKPEDDRRHKRFRPNDHGDEDSNSKLSARSEQGRYRGDVYSQHGTKSTFPLNHTFDDPVPSDIEEFLSKDRNRGLGRSFNNDRHDYQGLNRPRNGYEKPQGGTCDDLRRDDSYSSQEQRGSNNEKQYDHRYRSHQYEHGADQQDVNIKGQQPHEEHDDCNSQRFRRKNDESLLHRSAKKRSLDRSDVECRLSTSNRGYTLDPPSNERRRYF